MEMTEEQLLKEINRLKEENSTLSVEHSMYTQATYEQEVAHRQEETIKKLVSLWYSLLSNPFDGHHKDRDCHFNINIDFKYDGEKEIEVYHNGYIAEDWVVPARDYKTALNLLEDKLKIQILKEVTHPISNSEYGEDEKRWYADKLKEFIGLYEPTA